MSCVVLSHKLRHSVSPRASLAGGARQRGKGLPTSGVCRSRSPSFRLSIFAITRATFYSAITRATSRGQPHSGSSIARSIHHCRIQALRHPILTTEVKDAEPGRGRGD